MIFFKVTTYRQQLSNYPLPDTFSLNDLDVIDDKSFISYLDIPFTGQVSMPSNSTPNETYNYLVDIIGENVNTIYLQSVFQFALSSDYIKDRYNLNLEYIPSISASAPNYWNIAKSYIDNSPPFPNAVDLLCVVYIPSLKKCIANQGAVYSVDDNLVATRIAGKVAIVPVCTTNSDGSILLPWYDGYTPGDNLGDVSKWRYIRIAFSSSGGNIQILKDNNNINLFANLFSVGDSPDSGYYPPTDPFEPGGPSGPGELPPGTFDPTSDPIPDSPIPTLSMAATGFTRIFNPTLQQVNSLAEYMWKEESVLQTLWNKVKQIFENPMDVMIAFNIVPVPVPNSSPVDFTIMYIPTGVMLSPATTQFVDVDCGTCQIQGYYGSALDYSPYTKIHCYLPYIGMVTLDTDEVMNSTLQIKYRVDIVSGGCVAKIFVDGNVLYQYSGHCSISVPFSSSDFSSYMNAMLQVSAIALGAVSAGAAGAAAAGGASAVGAEQQTSQVVKTTHTVNTARNPDTGRQITTGTSTTTVSRPVQEDGPSSTKASYAGLDAENITNTVSSVMASKPIAQHSGSFNGNTGYLGVRYPYLVIEVPRQCLPSSYQQMNGYPSMITLNLGDCSGYTRIQQVQLTGMTATNPEQAEILQLLKGGVLL